MRWAAEAVLALAITPGGFSTSDLAHQVQRLGGPAAAAYTPRRAAYDLKKLRGKQLVQRIHRTRRYEAPSSALKILATLTTLQRHVIKPLLAAAENTPPACRQQPPTRLDRHYEALRTDMHGLFAELGIAA
jgi:hypothetical protein